MIRSTSIVLSAAAAMLSLVVPWSPSGGKEAPGAATTVAAAAASDADRRASDPHPVLAIAERCVDGRHVALVGNALRHGRVFTAAEALGWCDD